MNFNPLSVMLGSRRQIFSQAEIFSLFPKIAKGQSVFCAVSAEVIF